MATPKIPESFVHCKCCKGGEECDGPKVAKRLSRKTKCTLDEGDGYESEIFIKHEEHPCHYNGEFRFQETSSSGKNESFSKQNSSNKQTIMSSDKEVSSSSKHQSNSSNSNNNNRSKPIKEYHSLFSSSSKISNSRRNTQRIATISANVRSVKREIAMPEIVVSKPSLEKNQQIIKHSKTTAFQATLSPVSSETGSGSYNQLMPEGKKLVPTTDMSQLNLPKTKSLESMISILNHSLKSAGLTPAGSHNGSNISGINVEKSNSKIEVRDTKISPTNYYESDDEEDVDLENGIIYDQLLRVLNQGDLKIGRRCQEALIQGRRCSEITDCLHGKLRNNSS